MLLLALFNIHTALARENQPPKPVNVNFFRRAWMPVLRRGKIISGIIK
jgi:hypothetical protein